MPVPKRVTSCPGTDDHSLTPFEAVLRTEEIWQGQAGDAKIDRTFAFQRGAHDGAQVGVIARIGHAHVRQRAHNGQVLNAIVGGSRPAGGQPNIGAWDEHLQTGVTNRDRNLVQGPARGKGGKRGREWDVSLQSQPGGDAE